MWAPGASFWCRVNTDLVVVDAGHPVHREMIGQRLFDARPELEPLMAHHYEEAFQAGECQFHLFVNDRMWRVIASAQDDGTVLSVAHAVDLVEKLSEIRSLLAAVELSESARAGRPRLAAV